MKGADQMEYKKAITDTINELKGSFRPADDDELVRAVQERAKKMSNNNENLRQVKFTEITPEYIEPKKSHKTLNVFFGIAGTAAVLAGAVFGLNWLNEHGGLKGPDVQGAGYHDTSETTAYAQPDSTMIPVTVPSDCVYRFNGFTMQPKQFVYDGMSLEFTYDIIYDNGIPDNFENDIALRVFGSNVKVHPQDTTQLLFTNGNTAELMWKHTSLDVLESLEIWIMPGSESAVSADMTEQYKFTVEIPEDSPYLSVDTDKYIGKAETDTAKLTHFDICKNTVGFVVENYPISNPTFEASVNRRNFRTAHSRNNQRKRHERGEQTLFSVCTVRYGYQYIKVSDRERQGNKHRRQRRDRVREFHRNDKGRSKRLS